VIPADEHDDEIIDLMEGEQGWVRPDGELQTLADEGMIDHGDESDIALGDDANLDPSMDDDEEAFRDTARSRRKTSLSTDWNRATSVPAPPAGLISTRK